VSVHRFSDDERAAVYRAIETRRDVRRFRSDPISDEALDRLLAAAHHAPSVGFSQPWRFLVIRSPETKARVKASFARANAAAAARYEGDRAALYRSLKLEGICEAPVNLCVASCDPTDEPILGAQTMPETTVFSTVLAIENLWLAARAEGLGVGWVSIVEPDELRALLAIPDGVRLVAYLCIGVPEELPGEPMLQTVGWRDRASLAEVIFDERWGHRR
jgi:5,6-dimethylbenzimidazole synthase